jgi:hypothetical protein
MVVIHYVGDFSPKIPAPKDRYTKENDLTSHKINDI